MFVCYAVVQLAIILGFTAINSPVMIILFIILIAVLWIFIKNTVIINTGIRKISNVKKAPVFSKLQEAFLGSVLLKAYKIKDKISS